MRLLLQRVSRASVKVNGKVTGQIEGGLLGLLGVRDTDDASLIPWLVNKAVNLRIFEDAEGKMNRSLLETGGGFLLVSQFTLYAGTRRGRRPDFTAAAPPERAEALYNEFISALKDTGIQVETGIFGAMMDVSLVNSGPVTIVLERESETPVKD